jgi:glycosyltransferase involved in cell wall biosynthesis
VVAVAEGGPRGLIEHDMTGLLAPPDAEALADAVLRVAGSPVLGRRLAEGGLSSVGERTWAASLELLATGYRRALGEEPGPAVRRAA